MHCPKHKELGNGEPLVYAASWWPAGEVDAYLADKALPIWISLGNMELYRDIRNVCYGNSAFLEQCVPDPPCLCSVHAAVAIQQDPRVPTRNLPLGCAMMTTSQRSSARLPPFAPATKNQ